MSFDNYGKYDIAEFFAGCYEWSTPWELGKHKKQIKHFITEGRQSGVDW